MSGWEAKRRLSELAEELDKVSRALLKVEQDLEPVQDAYDIFVDHFEIGLYERSTNEDDYKLPAAAMRIKLAHRAMPPELYGEHRALVVQRERGIQRIRDIKAQVEAQRSILSAEKSELEATR